MVQCISHLCPHRKMNCMAENIQVQGGYHSIQHPMQVNILWLQDTLVMLSASLHLATFCCTYYQHFVAPTTNTSYNIQQAALTVNTLLNCSLDHTRHGLKVYILQHSHAMCNYPSTHGRFRYGQATSQGTQLQATVQEQEINTCK